MATINSNFNKVIFAMVLIISFSVAPLYAAPYTVTFKKEDLLFSKVKGYDSVRLKDGAYLTEIGKPQLPLKSIRVLIPPGSEVKGISIDQSSVIKLDGSFTIFPAQEFKVDFLPPPPFIPPDPVVYEQSNAFPDNVVTYVGESYIGSTYKVAHLVVFPLHYVPKDKELRLSTSITFSLNLSKREPDVPAIRQRSHIAQRSYALIAKESVINPEEAEDFKVLPKNILDKSINAALMPTSEIPINNGAGFYDYIIITSDPTMAEAFKPLADWRLKKGILTGIFTVSWIENHYSGTDAQEKIRNFIYDFYINHGMHYVLLGGNSDLVPARYSYIYHYGDHHNGEAATDLYYANCSVDTEAWIVYEGPQSPTPHVTYNPPVGCSINALLPRVNVGRLLVANELQATNVINKILTYEKKLPATDYQQTFMYHAADEGGRIGYNDWVYPVIPEYLMPMTRTLISDGTDADGQSTPENIISFMTGGSDLGVPFNFVWSVSHANAWVLTTNTNNFSGFHIDQIINQPRYNGSFYAWGCTSAEIGSTDPSILPTKWVNHPTGGGLAWIGSSIVAGGDHGVWHAQYYHEEMWEESEDYHHHTLGRAFAEAKVRMIETWPDYPFDPATSWCEYHAIIWNLVGDPLVPLFNHMPETFNAETSTLLVEVGVPITLYIRVEEEDNPVENALVCVRKANEELYMTDFTNTEGNCQFQLPPLLIPGLLDVTITKYNYQPYEGIIPVVTKMNYHIPTHVISGGVGTICSSEFCIEGTLGQSSPLLVELPAQSSVYDHYPGFWYTLESKGQLCDLAMFASAFGSMQGESRYLSVCDFDKDNDIDGKDLAIFSQEINNER
ncbi:MAG: C25 family cysteine peptidase [bacterium]